MAEKALSFGELLEIVDELPLEEQASFVEVLQRRLIERRREELAQEIQAARQEFLAGQCRPATPDDLMAEILS